MARSQPSAAREQVRDIVPGLIDLSERVLFGEVWERPGLSKRDRSLIVCATLIALSEHPRLFLLEHLLRYECGSHRRRPARVESEVSDDLAEFVLGETIVERPLQMADQLLFATEGDQGSADDQAAVALGEAGPLPNFAK